MTKKKTTTRKKKAVSKKKTTRKKASKKKAVAKKATTKKKLATKDSEATGEDIAQFFDQFSKLDLKDVGERSKLKKDVDKLLSDDSDDPDKDISFYESFKESTDNEDEERKRYEEEQRQKKIKKAQEEYANLEVKFNELLEAKGYKFSELARYLKEQKKEKLTSAGHPEAIHQFKEFATNAGLKHIASSEWEDGIRPLDEVVDLVKTLNWHKDDLERLYLTMHLMKAHPRVHEELTVLASRIAAGWKERGDFREVSREYNQKLKTERLEGTYIKDQEKARKLINGKHPVANINGVRNQTPWFFTEEDLNLLQKATGFDMKTGLSEEEVEEKETPLKEQAQVITGLVEETSVPAEEATQTSAEAISQLNNAVFEIEKELDNQTKSVDLDKSYTGYKVDFLNAKKQMRKSEKLYEQDLIDEAALRKSIDHWVNARQAFKKVEIEMED